MEERREVEEETQGELDHEGEESFFEAPSEDEVHVDLRELFRGAVRATLELVLEEEVMRIVGAGRYKHAFSRKGYRNGSYMRELLTTMGVIDVRMPRTREHGSPTHVIGAYKRRAEQVDDAIVEAYVKGVSTRGMGAVTEALTGQEVERSTVSRITKRLEEEVNALRAAPIQCEFPYVYLDATFLKTRWARQVQSVSALVAYGVNEDGYRELLAVTVGPEESEAGWSELLSQLLDRGLRGVRLVIADGHRGLRSAVRQHFPEVKLQRCAVHLVRNVGAKAPKRLRQRVSKEAFEIFRAPNLAAAKKAYRSFCSRWRKELPEAVACLERGFREATVFYDFPVDHHHRIRSTNGVERLHLEIKRRVRVAGSFPDRQSALRLVTAVAIRVANAWSRRRWIRNMTFEKGVR